jgi:hypothetical protein
VSPPLTPQASALALPSALPPTPPRAAPNAVLEADAIAKLVDRAASAADGRPAAAAAPVRTPLELIVLDAAREMLGEAAPTFASAMSGGAAEALLGVSELDGGRPRGRLALEKSQQLVGAACARIGATLVASNELAEKAAAGGQGEERLPAIATDLREIEKLLEAKHLDDMRAVVSEMASGLFDALLVDTAEVLRELHRRGPRL